MPETDDQMFVTEPEPQPEPGLEDTQPLDPQPAPEEPEPEPAHSQPSPAPDAADAALVEGVEGGVTWIPFAIYLGLWVVLAGLSAFFLQAATPEQPARWMPEYEPLLWGGVGLTALGPVLSLLVWWVSWMRRGPADRRGLFASVMTRGATTAFFGVLLWLGTLFILELIASGWTL